MHDWPLAWRANAIHSFNRPDNRALRSFRYSFCSRTRNLGLLQENPGRRQPPKSLAKASMAARWGGEYSSTSSSSPLRIAATRAGVIAEDRAQFQ